MKIYSDDGVPFKNVDECNAYEADLKLRKEKEEAERKAREEKQKQLKQVKAKRLEEINKKTNEYIKVGSELTDMINEYEKDTGVKVWYKYNGAIGDLNIVEERDGIDFAWSNIFDNLHKFFLNK